MACILLLSFAVRVHDSQAYRKMDVTMERFSRILELREILLSFQTAFNLVNAAIVCAILESILGLKPSVCLVFFPLSLCLVRWFWADLMNGRHNHITAVCVSLRWSGVLHVVQLPAVYWHRLQCA